jgi:hypothetical protein
MTLVPAEQVRLKTDVARQKLMELGGTKAVEECEYTIDMTQHKYKAA